MIQKLIKEFPVSTVTKLESQSRTFYTKEEVNLLIEAAINKSVAEARAIDEESMAKHNRDATVISMILGFTTLALFVDGLLRMLGIIPPFMHIDINILERIETDIIDKIKQVPIQKYFRTILDERYYNFYIPDIFCRDSRDDLRIYVEGSMSSTLAEFDKRPVNSYSNAMRAYTPHPEAPKNGEQVMTVDFKSCDLDEYNSLQERINEIREKLEEDDDDDDDDGNVLALNR